MKRSMMVVAAAMTIRMTAMAEVEPKIGEQAPGFTLKDLDGKEVVLTGFQGKYVVLEWTNYECPFVVKHYSTGNMQALQKAWMEKDVVWLVINSSAPGKQGHFPTEKWKELAAARESKPTAILLDTDGAVGKLYRARTTPEMYVISPKGILLYMGAIDDKPTTRAEDVKTAHNYVKAALDAAMAGKEIDPTVTRSYGCSVKY